MFKSNTAPISRIRRFWDFVHNDISIWWLISFSKVRIWYPEIRFCTKVWFVPSPLHLITAHHFFGFSCPLCNSLLASFQLCCAKVLVVASAGGASSYDICRDSKPRSETQHFLFCLLSQCVSAYITKCVGATAANAAKPIESSSRGL